MPVIAGYGKSPTENEYGLPSPVKVVVVRQLAPWMTSTTLCSYIIPACSASSTTFLDPSDPITTSYAMPAPIQEVQFKGYALTNPSKWHDLKVIDFTPKTFEPEDVEISITHCGVCGSDVHTLTQGWGKSQLPLVVGHEIIGTVSRVGDNVSEFKAGDRVGVGAQRGSCLECRECEDNYENYCTNAIDTYNSQYPNGVVAQGGYSTAIRVHERFVFPVPEEIESHHAASMMCAGLTVFSPLKTHGAGPGKKVGIMGIGGLGHYAILWAKAMGAEVYAFTHDDSKVDDIKKMGADHVINTNKKDFHKDLVRTLDILLSTRDVFGDSLPLGDYLSMLYVHGRFVTVGIPDANDALPPIHAFDLVPNGCLLGGSKIGSKKECLEMLELARSKGIKPWVEEDTAMWSSRILRECHAL